MQLPIHFTNRALQSSARRMLSTSAIRGISATGLNRMATATATATKTATKTGKKTVSSEFQELQQR